MATSFFIEFRLHGYARRYAKWARARIHLEARRLRIRELKQPRFVPHITLFGQAVTNHLRRVIAEVERIGRKNTLIPLKLGVQRGEFGKFQKPDANWLYLVVYPSHELEQFRYELAQNLLGLDRMIHDTCQPHDHQLKIKFHTSIGKYDPRDKGKFEELSDFAETKCSLETFKQCKASVFNRLFNIIKKYIFGIQEYNHGIYLYLLRVTILGRGRRIQCEYDLVLRRLLSRRQSLSRYWWRRTIEKLKELRSPPQEEYLSTSDKSVFFIGDTHFDHRNIIRYCHRPFSNVTEMNRVIKNNWNKTVRENDRVYFLGDYTGPPSRKLGTYREKLKYWTEQVTGIKASILGNHDRNGGCIRFEKTKVLRVNGYSFLLIHNPKDRRTEWHGWIIHGHVHNKKPFIDGKRKTINVSSEVINYKPVSLSYLLSLGLDSIKQMRTIDSQPERW